MSDSFIGVTPTGIKFVNPGRNEGKAIHIPLSSQLTPETVRQFNPDLPESKPVDIFPAEETPSEEVPDQTTTPGPLVASNTTESLQPVPVEFHSPDAPPVPNVGQVFKYTGKVIADSQAAVDAVSGQDEDLVPPPALQQPSQFAQVSSGDVNAGE